MANAPKTAPKIHPFKYFEISPVHITAEPVRFLCIYNKLSDNYQPSWSQQAVYGRMDPIGFFQGVQRELRLGIQVIAKSNKEAAENMQRAQNLIQFQYPRYEVLPSGQKTIVAAPYFKIKWMNAFSSDTAGEYLYGYMKGPITIDPKPGNKMFKFNKKKNPDYVFWGQFDIDLTLQVLHHGELVGWTNTEFGMGENFPYGVSQEVIDVIPATGFTGAPVAAETDGTPVVADANRLTGRSIDGLSQEEGSVPQKTDSIATADAANRAKQINKFSNINPVNRVNDKILGMS